MNAYELAQAEQRAAAAPDANVFVTANAGSGKTKVLIDRIARLLLEGAKPSAFLCITYTKAAAAEMQRRLFRQLGDWCVASDEKLTKALADLRGPGAQIDPAELPRARALFAQALETPGGLRIQTIHAFCERLLARFPLEAGAPPGFEIADETRAAALMHEAQAALCATDDEATATAFAHFATRLHNEALELLLAALAQRGADQPPPAHTTSESPADALARALADIPWRDFESALGALDASSSSDQDCAAAIRAARDKRDVPEECWPLYLDAFYTGTGKPRAKLITASLAKKEPAIDALFGREAQRLEIARKALRAAERATDARAAHLLAQALAAAYAREKQQAGVLDFADLIARANDLLNKTRAAPWVLYKLDGGIDHILIDEGQDTSPAQWDLVAPLQQEFFSGSGAQTRTRTVFAVGDPKQSIYSFQGADPQRFMSENQQLSGRAAAADAPFVAPVLEMSFRSAPEILRAVDATFDGVDLALGEPEKFNVVRHVARRGDEAGSVEIWPITPRPQQGESRAWDAPLDMESGVTAQSQLARQLAKRVKHWIDIGEAIWDRGECRAMRAGDVLALVQKRGPVFHALIKAFKREGLEVAGADRMVLRDELAIEDCLALMRVALDPDDDLSLASVLKGPWIGLTNDDTDLFPLAYGRPKGRSLYRVLMANDDLFFSEARSFIRELQQRSGEDAFSFLSWALETPLNGGATGWARVLGRLGHEARDPVEELLERALHPGPRAAPTMQRFLSEIDADSVQVKRELETVEGAIRVMTVHGAKGLEAPVVLLPDTTSGPNMRVDNGLLFGEHGMSWSPSIKEDDDIAAAARAEQEERARGEHWRLLYVAMTRARDRLVVAGFGRGQGEGKADRESWHTRIWEALEPIAEKEQTPFGEGLVLGAASLAERAPIAIDAPLDVPAWSTTPLPSPRIVRAAPSRLKDPAALSPRRDGGARFRRGRLIHGLLERLPDLAQQRRAEAGRAWLARQGVKGEDADALVRETLAVIECESFAAAFGPESRAEAPIVGSIEGRRISGVIDRLVIAPDAIFVLDFKSDRPAPIAAEDAPDSYVLQMALYRAVLAQILPGRLVRCALIWTERPVLTELSAAQMEAQLARYLRS